MAVVQIHDPKEEAKKIFDAIGDFKPELFGNRVLVAKFVTSKVSKSIISSASTQREDVYQGKIGLVIAVGPLAFANDANNDFKGQNVKVGDWVWYSWNDGSDQDVRTDTVKLPCKCIKDVDINGKVTNPDCFY